MKYYGIPDVERLEEWTALGIPFEYNDFMYPALLDREDEIERRIRAYLRVDRDRGRDTLHGPFLDITVHSDDRLIRQASDDRIRQVCEIALRLQVKGIILHTNIIPNFYDPSYRQGWVDRNEAYMTTLLEDYPDLSVYMENMFDEEPDCLLALAERMAGERFGICLDLAHANLSKAGIDAWEEACAPYISHYHINDNDGRMDLHLPVGDGSIDWKRVIPRMRKDIPVLLEVSSLEKYKKSLAYLRSRNL
ncbi:MAG: sugar phosphate isomerase/epimerase [Clostridiales bacterium]|nr:sugar phosphate isomerase/epimerase [Clostridiales bacterium]